MLTHSRINDHRPSSTERAKLRLKLALEYGSGQRFPHEVKVRCGSGANRSYRIDSYMVPVDLQCHLCNGPLQITDHKDLSTYCELDRIEAGGRYVASNLLPACRHCNASRQDADLPDTHVANYRAEFGKDGKWLADGRRA